MKNAFPRQFRFRLNYLDHYQSPVTQFEPVIVQANAGAETSVKSKRSVSSVSILRAFGTTDTGQRVCAHIHGIFPYLLVEYSGPLDLPSGKALLVL